MAMAIQYASMNEFNVFRYFTTFLQSLGMMKSCLVFFYSKVL